ncbi:MAG: hypothetical protein LBF23_00025 [Endomicrobium sp.]|jgi:hypothetical protein|nr:hypothetical protein [Endomicrobium sp.]
MKKIICYYVAFCCILSVFCSSPSVVYAAGGNNNGGARVVFRIIGNAIPFAILFGSIKIIINLVYTEGVNLYCAFLGGNSTFCNTTTG